MTAVQEPHLAPQDDAATPDERFAALVRRQSRFVFRVAYSVLRSAHEADDVVQEAYLRLYRMRKWESVADERAFLARTAWRIAVKQLRRRPADLPESDAASDDAGPEQAAITAERNAAVWRMIDTLPEELRQPLALSGVEELNSREIAGIMGIPEGTVRTRLMRARQILKQKLSVLRIGPHEE